MDEEGLLWMAGVSFVIGLGILLVVDAPSGVYKDLDSHVSGVVVYVDSGERSFLYVEEVRKVPITYFGEVDVGIGDYVEVKGRSDDGAFIASDIRVHRPS